MADSLDDFCRNLDQLIQKAGVFFATMERIEKVLAEKDSTSQSASCAAMRKLLSQIVGGSMNEPNISKRLP